MEIQGSVQQILVKSGKDHDVKFVLGLGDEEVVQLFRWRNRQLIVTITPRVNQNELPGLDGEDGETTGRFWIDEGSFPIHTDEDGNYRLTGKEIRELVEDAEVLYQWVDDPLNAGGPKRELVEDSALIELHDGDRFSVEAVEGEESEPIGTVVGHTFEGAEADALEDAAKKNGLAVAPGARQRRGQTAVADAGSDDLPLDHVPF